MYPKQPGPFFIAQFMSRHRVVAKLSVGLSGKVFTFWPRSGRIRHASSRVRGWRLWTEKPFLPWSWVQWKIRPSNSSHLSNTFLKFNSSPLKQKHSQIVSRIVFQSHHFSGVNSLLNFGRCITPSFHWTLGYGRKTVFSMPTDCFFAVGFKVSNLTRDVKFVKKVKMPGPLKWGYCKYIYLHEWSILMVRVSR